MAQRKIGILAALAAGVTAFTCVREAECQATFSPRGQCFTSGFVFIPSQESTVTNDEPSPEPESLLQCVETGHYSPGLPIILVDVDNPRIYTQPPIGSAGIVEIGGFPPTFVPEDEYVSRDGKTWSTFWSDFSMSATGGDVAPSGFLASGSVASTIAAIPQVNGQWGLTASPSSAQFPAVVDGLRVGYSSLVTQFTTTKANTARTNASFGLNIQLNPNVLLVPIEAVAIASPTTSPPYSDLNSQLALWDRINSCDATTQSTFLGSSVTDQIQDSQNCMPPAPSGQLDLVTRAFTASAGDDIMLPDGSGPYGTLDGYLLPDDVWAQCGIQFRLVNWYTEIMGMIPGTDFYYEDLPFDAPSGVDPVASAFDAMTNAIYGVPGGSPDPRHIPGVPVVMLPQHCVYGEVPIADQALLGSACLSTTPNAINGDETVELALAHELGHAVGNLNDTYIQSNGVYMGCPNGAANNLMCLGGTLISPSECADARESATQIIDNLKSSGHYFNQTFDVNNLVALADVLYAIVHGGQLPAFASESMTLGANVIVQDAAGAPAAIANGGTGTTTIGGGSQVGNVWSVGPVVVVSGARVVGFIESAGAIAQQPGSTVLGPIVPNPSMSLPSASLQTTFPPTNAGNVTVLMGQTVTLAPGAYAAVTVLPGGTLSISAGTYFFGSLDIEGLATVKVDQTNGPILMYVDSSLTFRSSFTNVGGIASDLLVGYWGTMPVVLQASFVGTLVALGAQVELTSVSGGHTGGFLAKDLVVDPGTTISLVPFSSGE